MNNILITGANGQLGSCLKDQFGNQNNIFYTDYKELDITKFDDVLDFIIKNDIKLVINCAAYTNVDKAEIPENYENVVNINAYGPSNLSKAISKNNGAMIHISTDYVFGKEPYNRPCTEEQLGSPSGVYGKTKKDGEQLIIANMSKYIIIRTSWLYSEYSNNFVKTMMNLMSSKNKINVIFDQVGTPTYAQDLANMIKLISIEYFSNENFDKYGIYNFSNEGVCSWYDFAELIKSIKKYDCYINPIHSSEYVSPVQRPYYSVLDKTKIKNIFNITIPYWIDSLQKCLNKLS